MKTTVFGDIIEANAGYIKEMFLVNKKHVEFLENPILYPNPEAGYVYIPGSMRIKEDVFYKISFAWRTCQFAENLERTANGFLYNTTLLWEWPKNNPAIQKFMLDNEHTEFVCFFRDGNDCYHISGNQVVGLELLSGRYIAAQNKISVSLQGNLPFPTLSLSQENDLELLFQLIEFSTEFSTDFNA